MDPEKYLQLTVYTVHPDCWTLEATADLTAGLIGYGTTTVPGHYHRLGYYTVYGDSLAQIDDVISNIQEATATGNVFPRSTGPQVSKASKDIIVETTPVGGLRDAFREKGYLHLGPTYHRNGKEERTLLTRSSRSDISSELRAIEEAHDAEITIRNITTGVEPSITEKSKTQPVLSMRQREIFELARDRGYYEYPREINATELADDQDISKGTLVEHLRKAERTILMNASVGENGHVQYDL